ncbi:hypothetical protein PR048_007866 [Dryococelus australis]|uniref:Uncharacterized protein n=1 Tax=Dryococelus australis TaxID=614101 RepID=A0ABQ9HVG9_9NEOP|nr:hypothetical protein PR048_007866 [Dryococelus australis]
MPDSYEDSKLELFHTIITVWCIVEQRLDSTLLCILEPQMFVHWLLPHRVAGVTSHLAVRHSLLVSLQVCYWLSVVLAVCNKLRSNCKNRAAPECKGRGNGRSQRKKPPINCIVRRDSHLRKSGVYLAEIEPASPWWEVFSSVAFWKDSSPDMLRSPLIKSSHLEKKLDGVFYTRVEHLTPPPPPDHKRNAGPSLIRGRPSRHRVSVSSRRNVIPRPSLAASVSLLDGMLARKCRRSLEISSGSVQELPIQLPAETYPGFLCTSSLVVWLTSSSGDGIIESGADGDRGDSTKGLGDRKRGGEQRNKEDEGMKEEYGDEPEYGGTQGRSRYRTEHRHTRTGGFSRACRRFSFPPFLPSQARHSVFLSRARVSFPLSSSPTLPLSLYPPRPPHGLHMADSQAPLGQSGLGRHVDLRTPYGGTHRRPLPPEHAPGHRTSLPPRRRRPALRDVTHGARTFLTLEEVSGGNSATRTISNSFLTRNETYRSVAPYDYHSRIFGVICCAKLPPDAGAVVRLLASHPGELGSISSGVAAGLSHLGIVPANAAGLGGFSRGSPVPTRFSFQRRSIITSLHKTSMVRAAQISSLTNRRFPLPFSRHLQGVERS